MKGTKTNFAFRNAWVIVCLLSLTGTASARTMAPPSRPEPHACHHDAFRFCGDDIPNHARIHACLRRHFRATQPALPSDNSGLLTSTKAPLRPKIDIMRTRQNECWFEEEGLLIETRFIGRAMSAAIALTSIQAQACTRFIYETGTDNYIVGRSMIGSKIRVPIFGHSPEISAATAARG